MDFPVIRTSKFRNLPRPEEGLRAVVERAGWVEEALQRGLARLRPLGTRLYSERRGFATASIVLLTAWLFVHVMFGANGMVVYKQKKTEIRELQQDIDDLQQQNDRSAHEVDALKTDPKAIEKEAREQLHYARPGEVVYVSPAPVPPQKPARHSAQK